MVLKVVKFLIKSSITSSATSSIVVVIK